MIPAVKAETLCGLMWALASPHLWDAREDDLVEKANKARALVCELARDLGMTEPVRIEGKGL